MNEGGVTSSGNACKLFTFSDDCLFNGRKFIVKAVFGRKRTTISVNPSENCVIISNDLARIVNLRDTDLPQVVQVTSDNDTTDSSCESDVGGDREWAYLLCEEHVDTEYDSITSCNSDEDLQTARRKQIIPPVNIPKQLKHFLSFYSTSEQSSDEDFPDQFFIFPGESGNIGLILGPDDWEKIEPANLSRESLTTEHGTTSTCIKSRGGYDKVSEVDSGASQRTCYIPVPTKNESCLKYGCREMVNSHVPKEVNSCLNFDCDRKIVNISFPKDKEACLSYGCGRELVDSCVPKEVDTCFIYGSERELVKNPVPKEMETYSSRVFDRELVKGRVLEEVETFLRYAPYRELIHHPLPKEMETYLCYGSDRELVNTPVVKVDDICWSYGSNAELLNRHALKQVETLNYGSLEEPVTISDFGYNFDALCDADSRASSCRPAPGDLGHGSHLVNVTTNGGCDGQIEDSGGEINEMDCVKCSNIEQWSVEDWSGENHLASNDCTSNVGHNGKPAGDTLYDCDLISEIFEDYYFDQHQGL